MRSWMESRPRWRWAPLARQYIARCDKVVVLQLDGWRESEGVQAEMALAREFGKRVDWAEERS
jgi:hypothetical protein